MTPEDLQERVSRWTPTMREYHAPNAVEGPWCFSAGSLGQVRSEGLRHAFEPMVLDYADRSMVRRNLRRLVETDADMVTGTVVHELLQGIDSSVMEIEENRELRRKRRRYPIESLMTAWVSGSTSAILTRDRETAEAMVASLKNRDTGAKRGASKIIYANHRWAEVSHQWEIAPSVWAKVRPDLVVLHDGNPVVVALKTTGTPLADASWWPHFRRYWLWSAAFHLKGMANLFGQKVPLVFVTGHRDWPHPWRFDRITNLGYGAEQNRGHDVLQVIESTWQNEILPIFEMISTQKAKGVLYGPEETSRT